MKLIDLLVKELPKFGGWPEGAAECERYLHEGNIDFYDASGNWTEDCAEKYGHKFAECLIQVGCRGKGIRTESVTREQYEAALAALQQPAWNGEGLPPVGCECEGLYDTDDDQWFKVRIIAHDDDKVIGRWVEGLGEGTLFDYVGSWSFRPIRTEAERKRDAASYEIAAICRNAVSNGAAGEDIYDAIAAGKIPGIKLDGDA